MIYMDLCVFNLELVTNVCFDKSKLLTCVFWFRSTKSSLPRNRNSGEIRYTGGSGGIWTLTRAFKTDTVCRDYDLYKRKVMICGEIVELDRT